MSLPKTSEPVDEAATIQVSFTQSSTREDATVVVDPEKTVVNPVATASAADDAATIQIPFPSSRPSDDAATVVVDPEKTVAHRVSAPTPSEEQTVAWQSRNDAATEIHAPHNEAATEMQTAAWTAPTRPTPADDDATQAWTAATANITEAQTVVSTAAPTAAATALPTAQVPAPTYAHTGHERTVDLSRITTNIPKAWLDTLAGDNLTSSSSLTPGQELTVGVVLKDRFVLKDIIGKGGMGAVFKALDLRKVEANDREPYVALKVLNQDFRDDPIFLIGLQRETKRAQTLSHPNIITVYDFDRDGTYVFMTMEFLEGKPLNRFIHDYPDGMPFKKAWPLIESMGAALAYAHKKNIVHSDFKPGNVFVTKQNEPKVLDFGIATAINRPEGGDATVFNARDLGSMTPAYASLEQILYLPPDPRDDIYALACVAYELLTGKHPYGRLSAEKALELNLQPKPIPGLKGKQWKALQRGLAFKQADRIGSVAEFLKLLQPRSKLFYGAWAAGVLAVALTGGNVYLNVMAPPPPPPPIAVELTPEQKQKIDDFLELASIHFDVGYLTAPTGSNALWAYQEILKIDPYNEKAINGIKRIADAEEQAAWEAYEKGDKALSLKKVLEGLEADPHHNGLLKLKGKLEG
jgi:serine/threonine protein kinase